MIWIQLQIELFPILNLYWLYKIKSPCPVIKTYWKLRSIHSSSRLSVFRIWKLIKHVYSRGQLVQWKNTCFVIFHASRPWFKTRRGFSFQARDLSRTQGLTELLTSDKSINSHNLVSRKKLLRQPTTVWRGKCSLGNWSYDVTA